MDKDNIRKQITELKGQLSKEEICERSLRISEKLFELPEYKNADTIFAYISFNQEIQTRTVIEKAMADGKKVAIPRVVMTDGTGEKLPLIRRYIEFVYMDKNTVYEENKGIREPVGGVIADCDALVIIPGLAFGKDMNRIGYGGGFYDRYFAVHKDRKYVKIALCYDFQVFDSLPSEEFDEKIDFFISG